MDEFYGAEMDSCLLKAGKFRPWLARLLHRGNAEQYALHIPGEDIDGEFIQTGTARISIRSGGRIDVGGTLRLGAGCVIRARPLGGFVIEIPPPLDIEIRQFTG